MLLSVLTDNQQADEQVTISGAGLTGTNTAKVCRWDVANLKVG